MTDRDGRLDGLTPDEQRLEAQLSQRSEILRQLRRAEAELDTAFTRTLREHLLHGEGLAPHPIFARRLRAWLLRPRGARPVPRPGARWRLWLSLATTAFALIGLFLAQLPRGSTFGTPAPTRADLVFNLPVARSLPAGTGPAASLIRRSAGALFQGPLHLLAPRLSESSSKARAYRLSSHSVSMRRARHVLKIHGPVQPLVVAGATWLVASDGGTRDRPLHSIAVSPATGQVVYHDRRNFVLPRSARPLGRAEAVGAARHWLQRLGWPGGSMPVRSVTSLPNRPKVRQVILGWPGAAPAAVEAATLWITPDDSVIEASLWPQLVASGTVPIRSAGAAWTDVSAGKAPVAVLAGESGRGRLHGQVQAVSRVLILIPGRRGTPYLVPAYWFQGTARIGSQARPVPWISLTPAR